MLNSPLSNATPILSSLTTTGPSSPLNRPPEEGQAWPDWRDGGPGDLREQLGWPVQGAIFDAEHNSLWYPSWEQRRAGISQALSIARHHLAQAPTMVPVDAHRYLPPG